MNNDHWRQHLSSAVQAFRIGMESEGGEELAKFIDILMQKVAKFSAQELEPLNNILGETLAAQSRKDYLWVADLLEYEIAPFLTNNTT